MSDIVDVFSKRRSVRSYSDRQVADELLRKVVSEAYLSPNAGNRQQLRMVVSRNRDVNSHLGKQKDWDIPDDYVIRANVAIGYPKDGFPDAVSHDKYVAPLYV